MTFLILINQYPIDVHTHSQLQACTSAIFENLQCLENVFTLIPSSGGSLAVCAKYILGGSLTLKRSENYMKLMVSPESYFVLCIAAKVGFFPPFLSFKLRQASLVYLL